MTGHPSPAEPLSQANLGVIEYRLAILERGLSDHRISVDKRFSDWQLESRQNEDAAEKRHKELDDKVMSLVSWKDRWEGRIQAVGVLLLLLTALNTILNIVNNLKP